MSLLPYYWHRIFEMLHNLDKLRAAGNRSFGPCSARRRKSHLRDHQRWLRRHERWLESIKFQTQESQSRRTQGPPP